MKLATPITLALLLLLAPSLAIAADNPAGGEQQWGDFSGTFILNGPRPAVQEIKRGGIVFTDETLVVDKKTNGVANVFVCLAPVRDQKLAVHPSYDAAADAKISWNIEKHRFSPHAITLRTSQTFQFVDKDAAGYIPMLELPKEPGFKAIAREEWMKPQRLNRVGLAPFCARDISVPYMGGWCLVQDHPYMAVTDAEGKFTIKNLPTGKATFRVWHEKEWWIKSVISESGVTDWPKGRFTIDIKSGANDLGTIRFGGKLFE